MPRKLPSGSFYADFKNTIQGLFRPRLWRTLTRYRLTDTANSFWITDISVLAPWHVLHAWQQHVTIHNFPELWKLLKEWICLTGVAEFDAQWEKIQGLAPQGSNEYITTYWLPAWAMWSARERESAGQSSSSARQICSLKHEIYFTLFWELTSLILFNSWHHVVKGEFLEGKRNWRLDHLVYVLVHEVMPYYQSKHWRQYFGFKGPDLEINRQREIGQSARPT